MPKIKKEDCIIFQDYNEASKFAAELEYEECGSKFDYYVSFSKYEEETQELENDKRKIEVVFQNQLKKIKKLQKENEMYKDYIYSTEQEKEFDLFNSALEDENNEM